MIYLKQGDTGIGIEASLLSNGKPLTNVNQIKFHFSEHVINANYENGTAFVTFNREHTAKSGRFKAEFRVHYADGRTETFPNDKYIELRILKGVNVDG